jgi:uncharacterized protein (DUF1684 family)
LLVALVLTSTFACTSGPGPGDDLSYVAEVEQHRADIEQRFRDDPETPIPPDKKDTLLPLQYYPIDPAFSVPASLRLSDERPVFEMPTSTGTIRRMQLVGSLNFTLQGQAMSLGAFVEDGTTQIDSLFVPFADLTTGTETYPAGRYLDLYPTATGFYMIDFNKAYNPYCAYNSSYECPYPPPSNRLKLAVRAGEKIPGDAAS